MKKLLITILFSLVFLSCDQNYQTIKIGAVLPLSGPIAQYGNYMKQGLELAILDAMSDERIQKNEIELIIEDAQADPRKSVDAFNKLLNIDNIVACIPATSGVTLALKPIANKNKIILINASAISSEIEDEDDFVYSILPNADEEGAFLAEVAYDTLKYTRAAIIYRKDASGESFKDSFNSRFTELGGIVNFIESHQPNTDSFRKIINKLTNSKNELVFVASWGPEVALFCKQAAELGLNRQIITYETFNSPKVLEIAGNSANGVIFCSPTFDENSPNPNIQQFKTKVEKAFNQSEINYYIAAHYDAMMLLINAIENGNETSVEIRHYLSELNSYEGITGKMYFNENGGVKMALDLYEVKNEKFVRFQR
jgi:branched-chain amino acid transport system substrate-binding protein